MDVSLTEELEAYVSQKVDSGLYPSASEVIRDGLRLLKERDDLRQSKLEALRDAIAIGEAQADQGRVRTFDEELVARIKSRGRDRLDTPGARSAMNEPRLTEEAEADLDELWSYIAARSIDAADRMVDAVFEQSRRHVRFPNMGQNRDDLRPGLRCFLVSPFVVFYRPVEGTIEVLRILHGARDIESIIGSEDE